MEIKSKDYQILIDRLEKEIERNRDFINKTQSDGSNFHGSLVRVSKAYIEHHLEMISFIKKVDKEAR